MKNLLRFSFLTMALFFSIPKGFTQNQKVNISLKNTSLESVFSAIRKQTDVNIIYSNDEVKKYSNVNVEVQNGTVENALNQALKNTQLTFEYKNNTVIIANKNVDESNLSPPTNAPKQTIRGTIFDRDSKITLPGASVIILESSPLVGASTDVDGNFIIENVPIGRHSIKVSFIGYEDVILSEILVGSVKEVVLNVELSESLLSLGQVSITNTKGEAMNEMATIGAQSFSVEETKRYAASIGDPARMAQSFAGVSTGDDASNEIIIRGNSPNSLLWRLEDVEIPSPNHFAEEGGSSGAVSILSSNMLNVSDFYMGAFSAEFGNALSGVFDIRLRNGNNQKNEYSAQIGVLGLEFAAEGPFKKGYAGSYLVNYRYSTLSLLDGIGVEVTENAVPTYQDLTFKVNLPTKKAGTFSIWGIGGLSSTDEKYAPDTAQGDKLEYGYSDFTKTGMYATGVTNTLFLDNKSFLKTVVSNSSSFSSETFDQMDTLGILDQSFYDDLQSSASRLSSYYNRKISSRFSIRGGVILSNLRYSYFTKAKDSLDNMVTYIDSKGKANQFQTYFQSKYKLTENIIFTGGLHYTYFDLNKDMALEPRLGLVFNLPKNQKIGAGFGMHSKSEQLSTYYIEVEDVNGNKNYPNRNIDLTRSIHYVISYEKAFRNVNIKAEAYYQDISNLPVANNPNKYWSPIFGAASPNDTLENIGKGRNYGFEVTLQKYFSNSYYFMLTSSIFESEYKAADGVWRSTKYNTNYISNVVGGKEFKWGDNKMIDVNAKVVWNGGKRLIPIDLEKSIAEEEGVYKTNELWSVKGADYFRLDVGFKLHFFRIKVEHIVSLDIQNVTNRYNEWAEIYNPETESIVKYPMAGLIPIVSYKVKF